MKMVMAVVASAGLALASVSPVLANPAPANNADTAAKSWVPATKAEQHNARGGGGGYQFSPQNLIRQFYYNYFFSNQCWNDNRS